MEENGLPILHLYNHLILLRYIQHRYVNELENLENLEKIDLQVQGFHSYNQSKVLEMAVQNR